MILSSFRGAGKWQCLRQWFSKCVTWISRFLRECERLSFGMPSKPQTFPNVKGGISYETSKDLTVKLPLTHANKSILGSESNGNLVWNNCALKNIQPLSFEPLPKCTDRNNFLSARNNTECQFKCAWQAQHRLKLISERCQSFRLYTRKTGW